MNSKNIFVLAALASALLMSSVGASAQEQTNNNTATGGTATSTSTNTTGTFTPTNTNTTGTFTPTNTNTTGSQTQSPVGSSTVTIKSADIPVSSATAPGLSSSNGTCMGSTSAGAQGMSFGLSFGSTWNDDDCNRRYYGALAQSLGLKKVAIALYCQNEDFSSAMRAAGYNCPVDPERESFEKWLDQENDYPA